MRRHGAQGILDTASKGQLEGEFGTTKEEEIVKVILERGSVQETTVGCHSFVFALFFPFLGCCSLSLGMWVTDWKGVVLRLLIELGASSRQEYRGWSVCGAL